MRPTLFKHRRRYGGATPAVGLCRGCDQSKHTFNYHSAEDMRNYGSGFPESRWLQCLWRQHPAPEVAALGVSIPLTGCASLKHILSILSEESCWRETHLFQSRQCIVLSNYLWCRWFQIATLQQAIFYLPIIYAQCIDELKLLSSLRALNQLRSSPRSQAAKFRIENDPRRSWCHQYSRPFF